MTARQVPDLPGFNRWWAAWPANKPGGYSRKAAKSQCLAIWARCHHETQAETIVRHVEWLKTTADWLKDNGSFIPMPITYLRQQRWDGAEIPEPPAAVVENDTQAYLRKEAEHRARAAAEAKARAQLGGGATRRIA